MPQTPKLQSRIFQISNDLNVHNAGHFIDGSTSITSATYPTANLAICTPFTVEAPMLVQKLFAYNGAVSGNIDMGIYSHDGTKIVTIGSTAQAGTNVIQAFDVTDTYIGRGLFYLVLALDNTTGGFWRRAWNAPTAAFAGMATVASSFPLPATLTLATPSTGYCPTIGLQARSVGPA